MKPRRFDESLGIRPEDSKLDEENFTLDKVQFNLIGN